MILLLALASLPACAMEEPALSAEGLGLPVVITGQGADSLLANSANNPAQLLGIESLP